MLLKIFFDANALITGSASRSGASFLLLQLCELGMLSGVTCKQVVEECRKNLREKLPQAEFVFNQIVEHSVEILGNPTTNEQKKYINMAHPKDLPILVSAIKSKANYLITFNTKHFNPPPDLGLTVLKPGDMLQRIRLILNQLT